MTAAPPYFLALESVFPRANGAALLALLRGAERTGLVDAWVEGTSPAEAARRSGLPETRVRLVADALTAHGVLAGNDGIDRLSPTWLSILGPGALISRRDLLGRLAIEERMLAALGDGDDYWALSAEDRLTYARGVSPDPYNPAVVTMLTGAAKADPDLTALDEGGRLLELGCGVAGRTLALLQGLPAMRAVGVELAADLAEEASRRAVELRVADRFEVVVGDAVGFAGAEQYDVAFWSQFFFPEGSRDGALQTLAACLRQGGVMQAPLAVEPKTSDDGIIQPREGYERLARIVSASWGVPQRTPDELVEEVEGAGFVDVEIRGGGTAGPLRLRAVRP